MEVQHVKAGKHRPFRHRGPPTTTRPRATLADPGKIGFMTRPPPGQLPEIREHAITPLPAKRIRQLIERSTEDALDRDLRQVEQLLERWAVTPIGSGDDGVPRLAQVQLGVSSPRPAGAARRLDDARAELVHSCINRAPAWVKHFARLRYRLDLPTSVLLKELGLKRRESIYPIRRAVLGWCHAAISTAFDMKGLKMPRLLS